MKQVWNLKQGLLSANTNFENAPVPSVNMVVMSIKLMVFHSRKQSRNESWLECWSNTAESRRNKPGFQHIVKQQLKQLYKSKTEEFLAEGMKFLT